VLVPEICEHFLEPSLGSRDIHEGRQCGDGLEHGDAILIHQSELDENTRDCSGHSPDSA
jgi:hypothetical protein